MEMLAWTGLGGGGVGLMLGFVLARAVFRSQAIATRAGEGLALARTDALQARCLSAERALKGSESYRGEVERRFHTVLTDYRRGVEEARADLLRNPDPIALRDRLGRLGRIVSVVPDSQSTGVKG